MTDEEIAQLLRSDAPIVVIEAPAGCGKTHQAADYAADAAVGLERGRLLVLTHTHAACSVIAERTLVCKDKIDIRTLDSLVAQIASAYRMSLDLPEDIFVWVRQNSYESLAEKVAQLLQFNPIIARHLAKSFPIAICDEHQDSNEAQDKIVQLMGEQGTLLRVFGDPMQIIPGGRGQNESALATLARWDSLKEQAIFGELETPHRWRETNPQLGEWILGARQALKDSQPIDLTYRLPTGINVEIAENVSQARNRYQLAPNNWNELNRLLDEDSRMLLLASTKGTVQSLRGTFRRRFPIWEGHTRSELDEFVELLVGAEGELDTQARAFLKCLQGLLVGFTDSSYGKRLIQEIGEPTANPRGTVPPQLKAMAELVRTNPNHIGFSNAADHLRALVTQRAPGFCNLHIDYRRELGDLIKLKDYESPLVGLENISRRRSRTYPKPPFKALSTIHKSKGLEASHIVVFACDDQHFPGTQVKRNLFYVALSRATESVTIVVSRNDKSPLVEVR